MADIGKFSSDDVEIIPKTLVIIMDFMISNLLIEGQVENYILIMNLEEANFGLRNVIMKILSFTSNAYRGRLFASYILSMPTIIRWGFVESMGRDLRFSSFQWIPSIFPISTAFSPGFTSTK